MKRLFAQYYITFLLLGAIILGSIMGLVSSNASFLSDYLDMLILTLIFFIFLEVPFEKFLVATKKIRFIGVAWFTNFVLIPPIGFAIAYLFFHSQPALLVGLLIYFSFPCTDWFLAFTKIAKGDTVTGSVLLPLNLITQIILYPFYIAFFSKITVGIPSENLSELFFNWFLIPFGIAVVLNLIIKKSVTQHIYSKIQQGYNYTIEGVLAVIVFIIFATNVSVVAENIFSFLLILVAVFIFFVITYLLTDKIANWMKFSNPLKVLYTMTTAARNAPLMLAITTIAIPNQPLIYAAIIIGMLVEFPHLTVLTKILSKRNK